MAPQNIASELKKNPFEAFRLVMTDGKTYEVHERDREFVQVGRRFIIIFFRVAENDPFFERYEILSLNHIQRIEPIVQAQSAS